MGVVYSKYFPVHEYYEKVVVPLDPRRYRVVGDKMICPLHNDHDPSLGVIHKKDGNELIHCFGCNFWGNIIRLHQVISKKYKDKYLTPEDAVKDLCSIFGVDYNTIPIDNADLIEDIDTRQEAKLMQCFDTFDIGDLKYLIKKGKQQKKGIGYYNTLMIMMISELKEM